MGSRSWSIVLVLFLAASSFGFDLDRPPVNYEKAATDNVITQLEKRLQTGETKLQVVSRPTGRTRARCPAFDKRGMLRGFRFF